MGTKDLRLISEQVKHNVQQKYIIKADDFRKTGLARIGIDCRVTNLAWVLLFCFICGSIKAADYSSIIEEGLNRQFNLWMIPIGEMEIMSPLQSQAEENDLPHKRVKHNFYDHARTNGVVNVVEHKEESAMTQVLRVGARTVTVTPTTVAWEARDQKLSTTNLLFIRTANCKVKKIIRDTPYESEYLSKTEQYRLVLGTYERIPTEFVKTLGHDGVKTKEYKFRALLKLNPFNDHYTFVAGDWGIIEEDGWHTSNVR